MAVPTLAVPPLAVPPLAAPTLAAPTLAVPDLAANFLANPLPTPYLSATALFGLGYLCLLLRCDRFRCFPTRKVLRSA